jgi:hypothetical protein
MGDQGVNFTSINEWDRLQRQCVRAVLEVTLEVDDDDKFGPARTVGTLLI